MKMKPKINVLPFKLYPFNIDVYFKHRNMSCTLLKNVYIIFLKNIINHNFVFICMVKEKTMELWFQFLNMYNEF
jgi:hypothetical protein